METALYYKKQRDYYRDKWGISEKETESWRSNCFALLRENKKLREKLKKTHKKPQLSGRLYPHAEVRAGARR